VLIPATRALEETGDVEKMVEAAKRGAESTKTLDPVLGRATYVGGMNGKELPPDPGAWGLMEAINGLSQVLSK
jgi:dihydroxyacetone kinase